MLPFIEKQGLSRTDGELYSRRCKEGNVKKKVGSLPPLAASNRAKDGICKHLIQKKKTSVVLLLERHRDQKHGLIKRCKLGRTRGSPFDHPAQLFTDD